MSSSSGTRGMMKVQVFRCIISSRDPCERALINLATARTEYSPGEAAAGVSHSFSIVTYQRGYLIQVNCSSNSSSMTFRTQAASDRDLHDWLYAINPLLAGQIKSKVRRLNTWLQPTILSHRRVEQRGPSRQMGRRQTGEPGGLADQSETGGLSLGEVSSILSPA